MRPRLQHIVMCLDDQQLLVMLKVVTVRVDNLFVTLPSLRLLRVDLAWCLITVTQLAHCGSLDQVIRAG